MVKTENRNAGWISVNIHAYDPFRPRSVSLNRFPMTYYYIIYLIVMLYKYTNSAGIITIIIINNSSIHRY